jgi:hypothetical protein
MTLKFREMGCEDNGIHLAQDSAQQVALMLVSNTKFHYQKARQSVTSFVS